MSCWEKAHSFYIPNGLFKVDASKVNQDWGGEQKLRFANAKVSSDIYTRKRVAFDLRPVKCGGIIVGGRRTKPKQYRVVDKDDDSEAMTYELVTSVDEDSDDYRSADEE